MNKKIAFLISLIILISLFIVNLYLYVIKKDTSFILNLLSLLLLIVFSITVFKKQA